MPTYTFVCDKKNKGCGNIFEIIMSISDYTPNSFPKCPKCHKTKPIRRDLLADLPSGKVVNKTLGSLAEKNTAKMSKDAKLAQWRKDNDYKFAVPELQLPSDMERMRKADDLKPPKPKKNKRKINK
jgi:putative FmdB family regulatory protein